jgi:hypothetical protein
VVSVAKSLGAPLRDVEVESFRTGTKSDREVLREAFAAWDQRAGGSLVFGAGRTYEIGPIDIHSPFFIIEGGVGLSIVGNGARLVCETVASIAPVFFVKRSRQIQFTDLRLHDRGYRANVNWQGAVLVYVEGGAGPSEDISLMRLEADRAVAVFICGGTNGAGRVRQIALLDLVAANCYYGVAFEENGDDVRCSLRAHNCRRGYFCYGVSRHQVDVSITSDGAASGSDGCIVVARFKRDTSDVAISARFAGLLNCSNLVHFVQIPPVGEVGRMSNVAVAMNVDPQAVNRPGARDAAFTVYDQAGGRPVAVSPSEWRNVKAMGTGIGGREVTPAFDTHPAAGTHD